MIDLCPARYHIRWHDVDVPFTCEHYAGHPDGHVRMFDDGARLTWP